MPVNNLAETPDVSKDAYDPTFSGYAKLWFCLDFVLLCLVEVTVIRRLWFGHGPPPDIFEMFFTPITVLFPGLIALLALIAVRKISRKWRIHPTATGHIEHIISVLVFAAYLTIQDLARFAFR